MRHTVDRIERAMREHGFKVTAQRREVIGAIVQSEAHLTPAAIYEKVSRKQPGIGLVTVYRTLEMLTELGFICEVHAGGNCRRYLMRTSAGHHHHLICSKCGKVVNFTGCDLAGLERRLSTEMGFEISGHLLEFLGECRRCRGKGEKTG